MFHLIKSNRMETLMEALLALLKQVPEDPMAPEWIGIQSRGMKQWITGRVASVFGICANLSFLFPRQILESVLAQIGPDIVPAADEDILTWTVMALLSDPNLSDTPLACLAPYFRDDPACVKQMQLSVKIATLMDNYQVYRPDLLLAWEQGKPPRYPEDPVESWQAHIWQRALEQDTLAHLPGRMAAYLAAMDEKKPSGLPGRICLFGISAMPPLFVTLFEALAAVTDIYLFLLTPSDQFFFDIASPRQMGRLALETPPADTEGFQDSHYEIANPLLASLGRSGREFQAALETLDYLEPFGDLFRNPLNQDPLNQDPLNQDPLDQNLLDQDPGRDLPATLLTLLQSDILTLKERKPGGAHPPVAVRPGDDSVCVHACHSPMREAQVLKDLLLDALERHPDLGSNDIIVMMPDIETYAPTIESVFSSGHPLPYAVSDRRKKTESLTLEAFIKIGELKSSRLELSLVLDLLLCPAIGEKFGISVQETGILEAAVRKAGILWGLDSDHRKSLTGKGYAENTWTFGLRRLFLGFALPGSRESLVHGMLPCPGFEGLDADLLGRFAHFLHLLFSFLKQLDVKRRPAEWENSLKAMVRSMIAGTDSREGDTAFLIRTFAEITAAAGKAGFDRKLPFDAVWDLVKRKLDKTIAQGSFLAGGITFCNLMPMRSIPFKVVALMGMDEAAFPRRVFEPGFDLMSRHPRQGDKKGRDEDRYLFLESLLSARERFIVTFTGMSIRDNSPIPCSGVVSELADVMNASFIFPKDYQWWFDHPLHPFHPIYFNGTPGYGSFSESDCRIARIQAEKQRAASRARPGPVPVCLSGGSQGTGPAKMLLEDLIRFFQAPLETFLKQEMEMAFPAPEEPVRDREPFRIQGLSRYHLGTWLLERNTETDPYVLKRAGGELPLGRQGQLEWQALADTADPVRALAEDRTPSLALPPIVADLDLEGTGLSGVIQALYREPDAVVRVAAGFGRITPKRLLSHWITHLALTLAVPGEPVVTRIVGQDPKGRKDAVMYRFDPLEPASAVNLLKGLAGLYAGGLSRGFAFFPVTCFALAEVLASKAFEVTGPAVALALQKAGPFWHNAFSGTGERLDRYVACWLERGSPFGKDPFDSPKDLMASGIVENALSVYRPLLENLSR